MEIQINTRDRHRKNMPAMTFDLSDFASYDVFEATLKEVFGDLFGVYLHNIVSDDYIPPYLTLHEDRVVDKDQFGPVIEYLQLDESDIDLLDAYWNAMQIPIPKGDDLSDYLRTAKDRFVGIYEDGATFAADTDMADEVPDWAFNYVDWDRVFVEVFSYEYAMSDNGYVFISI